MTRTILAIATAFLAVTTVLASAAEAGFNVRLGFGGPLPAFTAHGPSKSYSAKRHKKRMYKAAKKRKARTAKKRIAKKKTTAKKVATVKSAPIKTDAENENSTISTASLDKEEAIETEAISKDEPETNRNVGCKKFFPAVGMTLTVPCE